MSVHLFGVRHHGPGSARALLQALESLQPDALLIEGPPDANHLIPLVTNEALVPPVALLIYATNEPKRAAWYPFAKFSPEWQALRYGQTHGIHTVFMDLPQWHSLALEAAMEKAVAAEEEIPSDVPSAEASGGAPMDATPSDAPSSAVEASENEAGVGDGANAEAGLDENDPARIWYDPLKTLATLAGYCDGEQWWGTLIEEHESGVEVFAAIVEAMSALRAAAGEHPNPFLGHREELREAWMRTTIRAAEERFERIAIVCGAWHTPALSERGQKSADAKLLKKLPATKTEATWAPWTYSRLARASGYGAGIHSPGWYEHLWTAKPAQSSERWLARVAGLLRAEGLSASTAQVIDAVRLVDALVALRARSRPGLEEMNEASLSVFCQDNPAPLQLIRRQLIIGEELGSVPADVPAVPLQRDLEAQRKRLRLKVSESETLLDLDLRSETDRARSHFLHRSAILTIPWATLRRAPVRTTGTFHEFWELLWRPEAAIVVIEASVWGNTVQDAAESRVRDNADQLTLLPELTATLDHVLMAELPAAANHIMARLQQIAALTTDTGLLMDALPALADILRYGNVRQTDQSLVATIVGEIVIRICIGLPLAVSSLDDDAAQTMYKRLLQVHSAINLLQNDEYAKEWQGALLTLNQHHSLHGLLAGRVVRLLRDDETLPADAVVAQMQLALSSATGPDYAAAWLEGFLRDSGEVLLYDDALWELLNQWVKNLHPANFDQLLPLLRRTFSTFHAPDRKRIGERAKQQEVVESPATLEIDPERAMNVLPVFKQLLGIDG